MIYALLFLLSHGLIVYAADSAVQNLPYRGQALLEDLIHNTPKALEMMRTVESDFQKKLDLMKNCNLSLSLLATQAYIFTFTEEKCPIFLLSEHICDNCPADRKTKPHIRKNYEDKMTELYIQEIGDNNRPISYTAFASGEGFQDMVLVAKVLTKKPNARITVNLIDVLYKPLLDAIKDLRVNPITDKYSSLTITPELLGTSEKTDNESNQKKVGKQLIIMLERFKQFNSFLKTHFPKATTSLYLHDTREAYTRCRQRQKFPAFGLIHIMDWSAYEAAEECLKLARENFGEYIQEYPSQGKSSWVAYRQQRIPTVYVSSSCAQQ